MWAESCSLKIIKQARSLLSSFPPFYLFYDMSIVQEDIVVILDVIAGAFFRGIKIWIENT